MAKFTIELTRAAIRAALIFAAKSDIRYYLNSVCLHVGECGDARLLGCDGHRLALFHVTSQSGATPGEYIMPRDILETVKKAAKGHDGVTLAIDGDGFTLSDNYAGTIICGAKLMADAKYPDWLRVMPSSLSGMAGNYNPQYLYDVSKAVKVLGGKNGFYDFTQNGESSALAVYREMSVIIMPLRGDALRTAPPEYCTPRRRPHAVIETATGAQAFPCDPLQDVSDKRGAPMVAADSGAAPGVVAHCGADIAAWIDPAGELQKAGLLVVAHIGDAPKTSIRTILKTGRHAIHGAPVSLIHATSGTECAGSITRETAEKWGTISDIKTGGTTGAWYKTENEAHAEYDRITQSTPAAIHAAHLVDAIPAAAIDADYLAYLASMEAEQLQAAA